MLTEPTKQPKPDRQQNIYANQLMIPDAFTEIPTDFSGNYYCVPFPTGRFSTRIHTAFKIMINNTTIAKVCGAW